MTFGLLNAVLLLGLAGLAIPIIIHLLHRRRFEVVDWGAMQFLQISETTRRRMLLEEIILMILRMGLIGILVLGLAAPFIVSSLLAKIMHDRPSRDVVLVFDGSASMGYSGQGKTPHELAQDWGRSILNEMSSNDSVAVLLARKQVVPVTGELGDLTHDRAFAQEQIERLPTPQGSANLPEAIREALRILNEKSRSAVRDIIVLSDGQRYGWADENTMFHWKLLAGLLEHGSATGRTPPHFWVINLDANRPANPPNWTLTPVRTPRPVAHVHEDITFRTDLVLFGQEFYVPPYKIQLEVDGKVIPDKVMVPSRSSLTQGQAPLTFHHRFDTPGSHLVSVVVEPDLPPNKRPPGYQVRDELTVDNRRDFALEVLPPLPVLIVDGGANLPAGTKRRGADFLRDALSPAIDPTPEVRVQVVPIQEFDGVALGRDLPPGDSRKPRVLILADIPRLSDAQQAAVREYLDSGGGLLVTLGSQVDEKFYNQLISMPEHGNPRGGWLPAQLEQIIEAQPGHPAHLREAGLSHPVLERFHTDPSAWGRVEFHRWWKVRPGENTVTVARLTGDDPLLVEGPSGVGRVLLATVPLNPSWETNIFGLPEFPVLVHEIVNYLAGVREGEFGVRSANYNLRPGQPLRFRLEGESWNALTLQRPEEEPLPMVFDGLAQGAYAPRSGAHRAQLLQTPPTTVVTYAGTDSVGVYRLRTEEKKTYYYTGQADVEESNLAPCTPEDWKNLAELIPMTYLTDRDARNSPLAAELHTEELWWWLMLGVIGLLCAELWMTRRIVRGR
jgi:hypothetical protein